MCDVCNFGPKSVLDKDDLQSADYDLYSLTPAFHNGTTDYNQLHIVHQGTWAVYGETQGSFALEHSVPDVCYATPNEGLTFRREADIQASVSAARGISDDDGRRLSRLLSLGFNAVSILARWHLVGYLGGAHARPTAEEFFALREAAKPIVQTTYDWVIWICTDQDDTQTYAYHPSIAGERL